MEELLDLYMQPYNEASPVVYIDERPCQLLGTDPLPEPPRPGRRTRKDTEFSRNGRCSAFLMFEPHAGWRHAQVERNTHFRATSGAGHHVEQSLFAQHQARSLFKSARTPIFLEDHHEPRHRTSLPPESLLSPPPPHPSHLDDRTAPPARGRHPPRRVRPAAPVAPSAPNYIPDACGGMMVMGTTIHRRWQQHRSTQQRR